MSLIPSAGPGDIIRRDRKRADIQERRANPFPLIESTRTWLGRVSSTWTYGKPNVDLIDQDTLLPTGITVSASLPLTDNDDIQPGSDVVLNRIGSKWVIQNGYVDAPRFLRQILLSLNGSYVNNYDGFPGDSQFASSTTAEYFAINRYSPSYVTKSSSGWVLTSGLLFTLATVPTGTTLFTLPVGFRPAYSMSFPAINGTLVVAPNGTVKYTAGSSLAAGNIIGLNNIKFNVSATTTALGTLQGSWLDFGSPFGSPRYGVDGLGFGFYEGAIKSGSTGVGGNIYTGLPAGLAPTLTRHVMTANGTQWGAVYIYGSSGSLAYLAGGNTELHIDGAMWDISASAIPWQPVYGLNNWINYNGASYPTAAYYLRPDGLVAIKGFVGSGTAPTIFILPEGYRPRHRLIINVLTSNVALGRLDIYPDGQVVAITYSATWLSLESILFAAHH